MDSHARAPLPVPEDCAYPVLELTLVSHEPLRKNDEPLRKNAVPDRACRRDAGVRVGAGPVGIRSVGPDR
jgi:hypothetical protein